LPALPVATSPAIRNGAPSKDTVGVSLSDLLSHRFESLSPKHKIVAQFVANNPQFASVTATRELAERTGVNPGTITRFAKALGFSGFHHFRQELRATYLGMLQPDEMIHRHPSMPGDPYRAMIMRDIENLNRLFQTLDAAALNRVASLLLESRRTFVLSSGSYAAPALVLSQLCTALGLDVEVETRGKVDWVPRLATLSPKDLVIGISFWRCDPGVVTALRWARRHDLRTAAITDSSVSPLAREAQHHIIVPTEGMLFFQSVTAGLTAVYGLVAAMWIRMPPARRAIYGRIRRAYDELNVFE
jgi:DNA-binding MurR/RpiR family transcriptional regulator